MNILNRFMVATIVAPFAASFTTMLGVTLLHTIRSGRTPDATNLLHMLVLAPTNAGLLALICTAVVGWPIHALLRQIGYRRLPAYVLGGTLGGLLIGVVVAFMLGDARHETLPSVYRTGLWLAAFGGGLTAAYFWLIRRPDRDEPNPPTSSP